MKNAAILRITAISLLLALGMAAFSFFLSHYYWPSVYPVTSRHIGSPRPPTPQAISLISSHSLRSRAASIRFSPDGRYLLVAGAIGKGTRQLYQSAAGRNEWTKFQFSDKRLRLFQVRDEREIERLKAEPIYSNHHDWFIFLMPDFKTLITSSGSWNIKIIDIRKRYPDKEIGIHNGYLSDIALSPDGKILILGMTRAVQFRDAKTFRLLRTYEHGGQGTSVDFGRNSGVIRCSWLGMRSHYVDVGTAKQVRVPYGTREFDVTFSSDGNYFAEVIGRNQVAVWQHNPKRSFKIGVVKTSLVAIQTMQFSPDNKTLAVGGESSTENPVQFYKLADIRKKNIL